MAVTKHRDGFHVLNLPGRLHRVRLVARTRTLKYWSVGISRYTDQTVTDFSLHLGVISLSVKWDHSIREN